MKKSILMAIVALALLAAPAFAGDYSIVGNIDWGFGFALVGAEDSAEMQVADGDYFTAGVQAQGNVFKVTNDFTMLGFFGSIDANNSIGITMEYGQSGSAGHIDGALTVEVTDFNLNTNILGCFGLTDLPVTLYMTAGHGRLNLHNRFQQWTGWEIKRWKNWGAAHWAGTYSAADPGAWGRPNYLKFTVGIMNMVNVAFGVVPNFTATITNGSGDAAADVPFMIDAWTSGIAVGPAALDIAANLRSDSLKIAAGGQVTANMNFGALALLAFVGVDYKTCTDSDLQEGSDLGLYVAVKPSYNFGAGTVALGVWFGMTQLTDGWNTTSSDPNANIAEDSSTIMDLAVDLSASFSTFTIYGGILMRDLTDVNEDDSKPMKYDIGVKNAFGAATIGIGVTGIAGCEADTGWKLNDWDIGAADGSGDNWLDADGNAKPTMYMRVTAWY